MVALCTAQFFWSLSTLMYASYLPLYLKENLMLKNSAVSPKGPAAGDRTRQPPLS